MRRSILINFILAALAVASVVAMRVLPHPPNVAPVAAVALLSGALLPRKFAFVLPLSAMVISDMIIGFHNTIAYTWGSFILIGLLARGTFKRGIHLYSVAGSSVLASLLFYLITNFGVWMQGGLYEPTLQGLIQSYANAIPFFRNTLIGDLFYSSVLFGAYAMLIDISARLQSAPKRNIVH